MPRTKLHLIVIQALDHLELTAVQIYYTHVNLKHVNIFILLDRISLLSDALYSIVSYTHCTYI